jgi:hypothetical protein
VKLEAGLLAGKSPKISVLEELTVVNFIEPRVMIGLLPKFSPLIVRELLVELTVVLMISGSAAACAGEASSASETSMPPSSHASREEEGNRFTPNIARPDLTQNILLDRVHRSRWLMLFPQMAKLIVLPDQARWAMTAKVVPCIAESIRQEMQIETGFPSLTAHRTQ